MYSVGGWVFLFLDSFGCITQTHTHTQTHTYDTHTYIIYKWKFLYFVHMSIFPTVSYSLLHIVSMGRFI